MPATPIPTEMEVPEAIVWALAEADVPYVLGMPGGNTGGIFSALHGHPTMRAVQVRVDEMSVQQAGIRKICIGEINVEQLSLMESRMIQTCLLHLCLEQAGPRQIRS